MRALIDGDIVVYRCAASSETVEAWVACGRATTMISMIMEETEATEYSVFLTGSGNFRRELDASYKANRPDTRPKHWQAVRDFLVVQHKAQICDGYEADDELGIQQDEIGHTTVICSIDKDLHQIPGRHYNFVKKEHKVVSRIEGTWFLYWQALVGDRSDNIFGVQGIGPVKATAALKDMVWEDDLYAKCLELYNGDEVRLYNNLRLLYIWRQPYDVYVPPHLREAAATTPDEAPSLDGEHQHRHHET
jgi:5'-3' exonuclease